MTSTISASTDAAPPAAAQPRPRDHVARLTERYIPGEGSLQGFADPIRLAANEGPFGPSPLAVQAVQEAAAAAHRYPEGHHQPLRDMLAARHGIEAARIHCGAGSDECLALLLRAYAGPGDEVIHTAHGFAMYAIYARHVGATPVAVAETDYTADVDAILNAVTERTRLVFLANPNNPTGTWISGEEVRRLHAGLPPDVLFVLDLAYQEYVDAPDLQDPYSWVGDAQNFVITRTFSKAYGLGGLRLGWLYAPEHVMAALQAIRDPFNVNTLALSAGVASLQDEAHLAHAVAHNRELRLNLPPRLRQLGFHVPESQANFLLIDAGTEARAEAYRLALRAAGILVRGLPGYGLPHCLRVTIGTGPEMDAFMEVTSDWATRP